MLNEIGHLNLQSFDFPLAFGYFIWSAKLTRKYAAACRTRKARKSDANNGWKNPSFWFQASSNPSNEQPASSQRKISPDESYKFLIRNKHDCIDRVIDKLYKNVCLDIYKSWVFNNP